MQRLAKLVAGHILAAAILRTRSKVRRPQLAATGRVALDDFGRFPEGDPCLKDVYRDIILTCESLKVPLPQYIGWSPTGSIRTEAREQKTADEYINFRPHTAAVCYDENATVHHPVCVLDGG